MRFERGASGACHRVPNACESDPHRACVLMFGFCHARTNAGFALCARARRYEGEFMVRGPVTRVLRRAEGDGELLSGPQVLRRCICDVTGLSMSDDDRELNSPPQHKPRRSEFDGDADGDSINAAFKHVSALCAPELHGKLAYIFTHMQFFKNTGSVADGMIMKKAEEYERQQRQQRTQASPAAGGPVSASEYAEQFAAFQRFLAQQQRQTLG
jgi:hypothetical protein